MQVDWHRLAREVVRVHTRYQREVVETFSFCPWAKQARAHGHIHMHVAFMRSPNVSAALAALNYMMRDAQTQVGMLILPALALSRLPFAHFVAEVRALHEAQTPRGEQAFAMADFHPGASVRHLTAETLVPFLRRAPDPLIQCVRTEVLSRVRGTEDHGTSYIDPARLCAALNFAVQPLTAAPTAPLAARLAEHNLQTVVRVGIPEIDRVFDAIALDRTSSYAALGFLPPDHAVLDHDANDAEDVPTAIAWKTRSNAAQSDED
jgi:hypothetical protein